MQDIKLRYIWQHGDTGHIGARIFTLAEIEAGTLAVWLGNLGRRRVIARNRFTGLLDKNSVGIYEGDVLQDSTANYAKLIEWRDNGFKWRSVLNDRGLEKQSRLGKPFPIYDCVEIQATATFEVIGNIWEHHPNLLPKED